MSSNAVANRAYPELTWTAVIVGWFLGVIIAISIGYAALILGFSIEGSELAAILGFGILRGMLRRKSIIENNIVQTIASGVNGASSGMMFSVPAIFILGYGDKFDPVILTFGCIAGAFLGIAFIIPLRKHMIDFERLTYPGGVAVATILKSPGAGVRKAIILLDSAGCRRGQRDRTYHFSANRRQ
jgi:putative OPT family oligopeptide transporter